MGIIFWKKFYKGDKVIEYKGKPYTHKQVEEDDRFDNSKAIYLFTLNKKIVLDGDIKSNTAKYINHSCNPNCEVDIIKGKIWILAIQDIKKGMSFLTIMVLATMKIISSFDVNVVQKTVAVILSEMTSVGVLIENLLRLKKLELSAFDFFWNEVLHFIIVYLRLVSLLATRLISMKHM